MEELMGKIKTWAVLACSALTAWLGVLALPFGLLVVCNVIDYVTGLIAAPKRNRLRSSKAGFSGIVIKVCSWLLVVVGMVTDTLLAYLAGTLGWQPPFTFPVATLVCVWLLANELLSVVENIGDITGHIPPFLRPIIEWVKQKAGESGENKAGS